MNNLKFKVTAAPRAELLEIMSEKHILKGLGWESKETIPEFKYQWYIIKYLDYSLAFVFWEIQDGWYEAHLVCPKKSIRFSRLLALAAVEWLKNKEEGNMKVIVTSVTKGNVANFVERLGFTLIRETPSLLFYGYKISY